MWLRGKGRIFLYLRKIKRFPPYSTFCSSDINLLVFSVILPKIFYQLCAYPLISGMRWNGFWRWIRIVIRIFAAKLIKMIHVHSCSLLRALILLTISAIVIGYISSCSEADRNFPLLDEIKEQGNTDPVGALKRMDSIYISMSKETRHNVMRYELLRLRLLDKAGIMPSSDVRGHGGWDSPLYQ